MADLFDMAESQRRAEEGQELVASNNRRAVDDVADAFLAHLRDIAPDAGSMDSLRASGYEPPEGMHRNAIGSAIGRLSRAKLIEPAGVTRSARAPMACGKIYTWRLAEGGGA